MYFSVSDEFETILQHTTTHQHIPFNFNSNFIKRHFGVQKQRNVSYEEFTQILHVSHLHLVFRFILHFTDVSLWGVIKTVKTISHQTWKLQNQSEDFSVPHKDIFVYCCRIYARNMLSKRLVTWMKTIVVLLPLCSSTIFLLQSNNI